MKIKIDRIISLATLTTSAVALILVLKKPAPVAAPPPSQQNSPAAGDGSSSHLLLGGDLGPGEASVKDYQVNFEGDVAKGQFLTHIAGKDVWVTMEGHLGSKDGYATFDPTRIKIGDLEVPVGLVNDQLQK